MATMVCGQCGAPNPVGAAFCGRCGRPLAASPASTGAPTTFLRASQAEVQAALPTKVGTRRLWLVAAAAALLAMAVLGAVAYALRPQTVVCPQKTCTTLPQAPPLPAPATYTSTAYGFSVEYDPSEAPTIAGDRSVTWDGQTSDGGSFHYSFSGDSAGGRSPQQIVQDIQRSEFDTATPAYPPTGIPGADLGFNPGYGQVYDLYTTQGQASHQRLIILAAIKNGVAVELAGYGTYRQATPNADGHPNPASVSFVHLGTLEESINTVRWRGDPPL